MFKQITEGHSCSHVEASPIQWKVSPLHSQLVTQTPTWVDSTIKRNSAFQAEMQNSTRTAKNSRTTHQKPQQQIKSKQHVSGASYQFCTWPQYPDPLRCTWGGSGTEAMVANATRLVPLLWWMQSDNATTTCNNATMQKPIATTQQPLATTNSLSEEQWPDMNNKERNWNEEITREVLVLQKESTERRRHTACWNECAVTTNYPVSQSPVQDGEAYKYPSKSLGDVNYKKNSHRSQVSLLGYQITLSFSAALCKHMKGYIIDLQTTCET